MGRMCNFTPVDVTRSHSSAMGYVEDDESTGIAFDPCGSSSRATFAMSPRFVTRDVTFLIMGLVALIFQ
jgi:hypothetical protein